jgi:hypothetical protein
MLCQPPFASLHGERNNNERFKQIALKPTRFDSVNLSNSARE